jgi:ribosomal protein S27AE
MARNNTDLNRQWRWRNPEKARAHASVRHALESGKLVKQPCAKCGAPKAHAHHEDYSKRLEVVWLCSTCHRALHTERAGNVVGGADQPHPPSWPHRKHYQPAPKRDALLARAKLLASTGRSYRDIGRELGVSAGTAYKWVNVTRYT